MEYGSCATVQCTKGSLEGIVNIRGICQGSFVVVADMTRIRREGAPIRFGTPPPDDRHAVLIPATNWNVHLAPRTVVAEVVLEDVTRSALADKLERGEVKDSGRESGLLICPPACSPWRR